MRLHTCAIGKLFQLLGTFALVACGGSVSPPDVIPGDEQTVNTGAFVQLDASRTSDPQNRLLTFGWSFLSRPLASETTLVDAGSAKASFLADMPGEYMLKVTVSNTVRVNEATVKVTATTCGASSPVVNAIHSTRTSMNIGDTTQLTADVADADNAAPCSQNQTFTYTWELLRQPTGSTASLNNAHSETPSLTADKGGDYVVRLTLKDSTGLSSQPKTFTVTVGNCGATNPTAVIAAPASAIAPNSPAQLTATASDADVACGAQTFTYQWSVRAKPDGATASFSSSVIRNPLFAADKAGQYEIGVAVTDVTGRVSDVAVATVTVDECATPAPSLSNVTVSITDPQPGGPANTNSPLHVGGSVRLTTTATEASACGVAAGTLSLTWNLVQRPAGSGATLDTSTAGAATFVADRNGHYRVTVVATDARGNQSAPKSVDLDTTSCGNNPIAAAIQDVAGARAFDDHVLTAIHATGRTFFTDDDDPTRCPARFAGQYAFTWSVPSSAPSAGFVFDSAHGTQVKFTPGGNAVYDVRLVVAGALQQADVLSEVFVSCPDVIPKAGAISLASSTPGYPAGMFFRDDTATLSAAPSSLCFSPGSTAYTYVWSLLSRPATSASVLSAITSPTPSFVADVSAGTWTPTVIVVDKLGNRSLAATASFTSESCGVNPVTASIGTPTRPSGNLAFDPYSVTASAHSDDDDSSECPARFAQTYSIAWSVTSAPDRALTLLSPLSATGLAPNATTATTLRPGGNATYTITAHAVGSKSGNTANPFRDIDVLCGDVTPTKVTNPSISLVTQPGGNDGFTRAAGQFFRDDTLTLTATASSTCFSPGNTAFIYAWTLSSVNPPTLNGGATQTPSFTVNTPAGAYIATVVATDSLQDASLAGQHTFTADSCGANAVLSKITDTSAGLAFDPHSPAAAPETGAFFSADDNPAVCPARFAQTYAFAWSLASQPAGTAAGVDYLFTSSAGTAQFASGTNGSYDVQVVATGSNHGSSTAHDVISVNCATPAPAVSMPDGVAVSDPDDYLMEGHIFSGDTVTVTGSATHACFTGANFVPSYNWALVTNDSNPQLANVGATATFHSTIPNGSYALTFRVRDQWNHLGTKSHDFASDVCGASPITATAAATQGTGALPMDPWTLTASPATGTHFSDDSDSSKCPSRFTPTYTFVWSSIDAAASAFSSTTANPTTFTPTESKSYAIHLIVSGNGQSGTADSTVNATCDAPTANAPTIASVNGAALSAQTIFAGDAVGLKAGTATSACFAAPTFTYSWHATRDATLADEEFQAASTTSTTVLIPVAAASHYEVSYSVSDGAKQSLANTSAAFDTANCAATSPALTLVTATQSLDAVMRIVGNGGSPSTDSLNIAYPNPEDGGPPAADAGLPVGTVAVPFYLDRDVSMIVRVDDPPGASCGSYQVNSATLLRPFNSDAGLGTFAATNVATGGTLSFTFKPDVGTQNTDGGTVVGQYAVHLDITTPAHQNITADTAAVPVEGNCGLNPPVAFFEMTPPTGPVGTTVELDGGLSADQDNQILFVSTSAPTTGCGLDQPLTYHWAVQDPADAGVDLPRNNTTDPGQSFTATLEGQYTVSLTVDDGKLSSATDTQAFMATDGGTP